MKVADVMTHGVDLIDAGTSVKDAATRMAELDVGAVFVGAEKRPVGVLTDRDILVRVVVEGSDPNGVTVRDVMTGEIVCCNAEDGVETAIAAMREGQFRRMPVLDESGSAIGVVTLSDLARSVESPEKVAETVREIVEPHRSRKDAGKDDDGTGAGSDAPDANPRAA